MDINELFSKIIDMCDGISVIRRDDGHISPCDRLFIETSKGFKFGVVSFNNPSSHKYKTSKLYYDEDNQFKCRSVKEIINCHTAKELLDAVRKLIDNGHKPGANQVDIETEVEE